MKKSQAKIGMQVKVIKTDDGQKAGDITTITATEEIVMNKNNHTIDLSKWPHVVQVEKGWLLNINNIVKN